MTEPDALIFAYLKWLKERITVRQVDDWIQVTTPFLDRHNDALQIFVKPEGNGFVLSDDGHTLGDLAACGCDLSSPKRKDLLLHVLRGFGVELVGEELVTRSAVESFPQRKHSLLQAMLSVNDLFLTNRTVVRGLFFEEVADFLRQNQVRHLSSVPIAGKKLSHTIDYVIPAWGEAPVRLLSTINSPTRVRVQSMLFAWNDIRELHPDNRFYAMVNDAEHQMSAGLTAACETEGVQVVPWSRRKDYADELSA